MFRGLLGTLDDGVDVSARTGPTCRTIRGAQRHEKLPRQAGGDPEAIRDGWFRTGDLACRDADGFYYIVDRSEDLVIRGGFNVYPREIEELLMTHPAVSLVAVVGVRRTSTRATSSSATRSR